MQGVVSPEIRRKEEAVSGVRSKAKYEVCRGEPLPSEEGAT